MSSLTTIRNVVLATAALLVLSFSTPAIATVAAASNPFKNSACNGLEPIDASGCTGGGTALNTTVRAILNILSVIVGVAAVIMIILSGLRYITSGGDASKVGAAKSSLIYALIGLVIVALAQVIVHFVFAKVT
jgi:hypothetical protein